MKSGDRIFIIGVLLLILGPFILNPFVDAGTLLCGWFILFTLIIAYDSTPHVPGSMGLTGAIIGPFVGGPDDMDAAYKYVQKKKENEEEIEKSLLLNSEIGHTELNSLERQRRSDKFMEKMLEEGILDENGKVLNRSRYISERLSWRKNNNSD